MTVSPVYTDTRHPSRPHAVTVRRGEFVDVHRFAREGEAEALRERLVTEGAESSH